MPCAGGSRAAGRGRSKSFRGLAEIALQRLDDRDRGALPSGMNAAMPAPSNSSRNARMMRRDEPSRRVAVQSSRVPLVWKLTLEHEARALRPGALVTAATVTVLRRRRAAPRWRRATAWWQASARCRGKLSSARRHDGDDKPATPPIPGSFGSGLSGDSAGRFAPDPDTALAPYWVAMNVGRPRCRRAWSCSRLTRKSTLRSDASVWAGAIASRSWRLALHRARTGCATFTRKKGALRCG